MFCDLASGLGEGILSGDHIIHGAFQFGAFSFELTALSVTGATERFASSLVSMVSSGGGSGFAAVIGCRRRGTPPRDATRHSVYTIFLSSKC
jgi:hypothetical protein